MNKSAKGRRNEYKSRRILEKAGYVVIRAAASRGPFDLWGSSRAGTIYCQVKSNSWPDDVEMEDMLLFPSPKNSVKVIHRWRDGKRLPDVKEVP